MELYFFIHCPTTLNIFDLLKFYTQTSLNGSHSSFACHCIFYFECIFLPLTVNGTFWAKRSLGYHIILTVLFICCNLCFNSILHELSLNPHHYNHATLIRRFSMVAMMFTTLNSFIFSSVMLTPCLWVLVLQNTRLLLVSRA